MSGQCGRDVEWKGRQGDGGQGSNVRNLAYINEVEGQDKGKKKEDQP
jgi:hypothetical protein